MSTEVDKLIRVQDLDIRVLRLRKELEAIPTLEEEIADSTARQKASVEAAKGSLQEAQAAASDLELEVTSNQQHILKLREQQLQLKTNKEFKTMEEEIRAIEGKISKTEDKQLTAFDVVDKATQAVSEAENELKKAESVSGEEIGEMKERGGEINAALAEIEQERAQATEDVDPAWFRHYDRTFKNKGGEVLVEIEHGTCGGCHMALPPHIRHAAKVHDTIVTCSFCGRMLY